MKIAYGVMGYGRGHAMRTAAVLPALMKHHEVTVYAGNDAWDALSPNFPTVRIPTLGYRYTAEGNMSLALTAYENFSIGADLILGGETSKFLDQEFERTQPDLVISDSEGWTLRAAKRFGIPTITFDHVSIIAHCLPPLPRSLWWRGHFDSMGYKMLIGEPDRLLISSFHTALPRRSNIDIVGPILRPEITALKPTEGDYLLAYFNKGEHQYKPHVEKALRSLPHKVVVYGTGREPGCDGNLEYKAPSRETFAKDIAGCKSVLSTAGNQLLGEVLHFAKPVFVLPEDCFEQRLNAFMVLRMGIGARGDWDSFNGDQVESFLLNHQTYKANMSGRLTEGTGKAIELLYQYIAELTDSQNPLQPYSDALSMHAAGAY